MLFNKNNEGSQELYRITGTFPAATQYTSIAPEIESATSDLSTMVGKDIIVAAERLYAEDQLESELLAAVRLVVASKAVANFVKLSGVSHGETGRKIKVDDGEKIPFAWMVDRDDRELRERYYRSLDRLFRTLATEKNAALWKGTDIYKRLQNVCVRTMAQFEAVYPIDGSYYTFYMLLPLMEDAQSELTARIGDFSGLKNQRRADEFIILTALSTAVQRWSVSIFPDFIARRLVPGFQGGTERTPAELREIEYIRKNFDRQAAESLSEMRRELHPDEGSASALPNNDPSNKFFTV